MIVALSACGSDGDDSRRHGNPDAHVDVDGGNGPVDAGPDGALPDGALPDGALPDGALPDGALPDGPLPDGALPDGALPDAASIDAAIPIDAGPPIDAPPSAGTWTDLGLADNASASNERVMNAGGMAFDASSGAITIVWRQGGFASGSSQSQVWGNRYTPGDGWATPTMLQGETYAGYGELQIIGSPDGSATAIWTQAHGFPDDDTPPDLWANRFVPGTGWTGAARLEQEAGAADKPVAWIDTAHRVNVAWRQRIGTTSELRTTHLDAATWTPATAMAGTGADADGFDDLTIDAAGNLLAIWTDHQPPTLPHLRANRRTATGWGSPVILDDGLGGVSSPRLDGNAAGDAFVVWYQHDDVTPYNVWAARFTPATGWQAAVRLEHVDDNAWTPDIAVDPAGRAVAVWTQATPVGQRPWASRYQAGAWTDPVPLTDAGGYDPHVVVDAQGNATAVWWDYGHTTWARRFTGTWQTPVLLQQEDALAGDGFPLAISLPDGRVAVSLMRASNHLAVKLFQP